MDRSDEPVILFIRNKENCRIYSLDRLFCVDPFEGGILSH